MNNQKKLFVLIGAGFSTQAGLPLAKDIVTMFTRDNKNKILQFSSSETKWIDYASEPDLTNGRLGFDHIAYGYILNSLVTEYKKTVGEFVNYEDFYQFLVDNYYNKPFLQGVLNDAQNALLKDKPHLSEEHEYNQHYLSAFKNFMPDHLHSLINHLIGDLLYCRKPKEDIDKAYIPFISFLAKYDEIVISTLNHDRLMEYLLSHCLKREYSDGFNVNQKEIFSEEGNPLKVFNSDFEKSTLLLKLHGSLDIYRYDFYNQKSGTAVQEFSGRSCYFKTSNYHEKHLPVRRDASTGEVIQTFHPRVTPQFITGTNKETLISNNEMHSKLYTVFEEKLKHCDALLIVGYSYSDQHVNKQLQAAISGGGIKRIINIRPSMAFPLNPGKVELISIKTMDDLIKYFPG